MVDLRLSRLARICLRHASALGSLVVRRSDPGSCFGMRDTEVPGVGSDDAGVDGMDEAEDKEGV